MQRTIKSFIIKSIKSFNQILLLSFENFGKLGNWEIGFNCENDIMRHHFSEKEEAMQHFI